MMRFNLLTLAAAAALCGGLASSALAATLLEDHFDDNSLANGTAATETDTAWYAYNSNSGGTAWGITTDSTTPLSGSVMRNNGGSAANTAMVGDLPGGTATLSHPGDTVTVSFDCRVTSVVSTSALQISLGNNNGTSMISNEFGSTATAGTTGNMAGDDKLVAFTNLNNSNYFQSTVAHSVVLKLTLNADGTSLTQTESLDGTNIVNSTISSPATLSFNEIRFTWGGNTNGRLDNIIVSVPEPATLSTGGLTLIGLLYRRRRMMK